MRIAILFLLPVLPVHAQDPTPFLAKHCVECHGEVKPKADLRLDNLGRDFTNAESRHAWKKVLDRVQAGTMPPTKKRPPPKAESDSLIAWLEAQLAPHEKARQLKEGRAVLRRLNRTEYENTLRDLLGLPALEVKDMLPADAVSHGFDNLGESLNVSSVQMQRYLEAAEHALSAAIAKKPKPPVEMTKHTYDVEQNKQFYATHWLKRPDGATVIFQSGSYPNTQVRGMRIEHAGLYRIRIEGYTYQSKSTVPVALHYGNFGRGLDIALHGHIELAVDTPTTVEVILPLNRGDGLQLTPQGLKNYRSGGKDPDKPETYKGPGMAILGVTVEGPLDDFPSRGHKLLLGDLPLEPRGGFPKNKQPVPKYQQWDTVSKTPEADAKRLLPGFLSAAFRRPVSEQQAEPYLTLFAKELKKGSSFEESMKSAAMAALCSPDFLYLKETPGKLDDYALASRLSYFLWRTMPDAELLAAAKAGQLTTPVGLRAQTERLLKHANAQKFVADFTDAWLNLRDLDFTMPDAALYPEFDLPLRDAMPGETRAFFNEVLTNNLPASTFIASDFAMLNARLAKHYGIPGVEGMSIRKVPLPKGSVRGGLLPQASVLKVSANGSNTSPVVRGVYVLERFLGTVPPPPPPGVPAVEPDIRGATTVRELLAKHRSIETCAGCHRLIDPPGFALENFDVIGGYRDAFRVVGQAPKGKKNVPGTRYYDGLPVDAAGELLDSRKFAGFEEFRTLLLADPDRFAKCLTEKLLTFATGREVGLADRIEVNAMVKVEAANKHTVRDMIHGVVQSEIFRSK